MAYTASLQILLNSKSGGNLKDGSMPHNPLNYNDFLERGDTSGYWKPRFCQWPIGGYTRVEAHYRNCNGILQTSPGSFEWSKFTDDKLRAAVQEKVEENRARRRARSDTSHKTSSTLNLCTNVVQKFRDPKKPPVDTNQDRKADLQDRFFRWSKKHFPIDKNRMGINENLQDYSQYFEKKMVPKKKLSLLPSHGSVVAGDELVTFRKQGVQTQAPKSRHVEPVLPRQKLTVVSEADYKLKHVDSICSIRKPACWELYDGNHETNRYDIFDTIATPRARSYIPSSTGGKTVMMYASKVPLRREVDVETAYYETLLTDKNKMKKPSHTRPYPKPWNGKKLKKSISTSNIVEKKSETL